MHRVYFKRIDKISEKNVMVGIDDLLDKTFGPKNDFRSIFLKVNAMSGQLVPGTNTSPWVIKGILAALKKRNPDAEIFFGDADLATTAQLKMSAERWGYLDIAEETGTQFVNLSNEKTRKVKINGKAFKELNVPKILLDCDAVITAPVMKTHYLTSITCCLKNQWGCVPRFRHQYHLVADWAIPEINSIIRPKLAIVDGTIGMEGTGPRTGVPKVCNVLFASKDIVAADAAVARYMGFNPYSIKHLEIAEKMGLGSRRFEIVGDRFASNRFVKPKVSDKMIFNFELKLRKSPLEPLIFHTKLFDFFAWGATFYNERWWYLTKGKALSKKIFEESAYRAEFAPLLKKSS